ncbi:MAG: hypothetical protein IPG09_10025 [Ignavibacteria bacterium]|nr:hypothetical protein [Ignavibacteria bacterium]
MVILKKFNTEGKILFEKGNRILIPIHNYNNYDNNGNLINFTGPSLMSFMNMTRRVMSRYH